MVICSRCQYWEVGVTPDRRECDICRLLHEVVQLAIGGNIALEQDRCVAEQLRFFFAGLSYLAERHPNRNPGPGHVNDWISQRPLSLVSPPGEAGDSSSSTRAPTGEAPAAASKAAPSPSRVRLVSRQAELAQYPVGQNSQVFNRLYGPFEPWTPSLRHRSPSLVRTVTAEPSQPSTRPQRVSPSPLRGDSRPPLRRTRSPVAAESAKTRRARRNLSPRYRRPLPDDPEISSHSSDSDLTWWSSESDEDLAPDDHPIPKRDKRLGKLIQSRELVQFGRKPLTRFSEGLISRSPSRFHQKKKKANKGRKKRERQQAIRDGTFVPRSHYQDHAQESKGQGKGESKGKDKGGRYSSSSYSYERSSHR